MDSAAFLVFVKEQLELLLGEDPGDISLSTIWDEIPNFESFHYVNLIAIIEMEAGCQFNVAEVESFDCLQSIFDAMSR